MLILTSVQIRIKQAGHAVKFRRYLCGSGHIGQATHAVSSVCLTYLPTMRARVILNVGKRALSLAVPQTGCAP
jgi:hypothetical protein